jgi:hypothetical protein
MINWLEEVWNKEAQSDEALVLEDVDGSDTTVKVFPAHGGKDLDIGSWWDGNDGEWTPEYLTITMDKAAVIKLRDRLNDWLGH